MTVYKNRLIHTYIRSLKDDEQHGDADAHDRDASAHVRRLGMSPEQGLGRFRVRRRRRRRISVGVVPLFVDNIVD